MSVFQSFMSEQLEEAKAVGEVERLLEEHAKSRELATIAINQPPPALGHDLVDAVTPSAPAVLPELTETDKLRIGQIMALIRGPHTKAVLKVVRRYMPDLFAPPSSEPLDIVHDDTPSS